MGRPQCYRCHKPAVMCVCHHLTPVPTRTLVTVLQHPRERFHPIGTARLARLALPRCHVEVCWQLQPDPALTARLAQPGTALLYPGPAAVDLAAVSAAARPRHLVLLDGTWSHARALYRSNPQLHSLPHVCLTPDQPSRYRIRSEPKEHYTSTIEALVQALRLLEPDTPGLDGLLGAFGALIDAQLPFVRQHPVGTRCRQRPRPSRRPVPPSLERDFARLVVTYGELAWLPTPDGGHDYVPIAWVGHRPASGATFRCLIRPPGAWPQEAHLAHMGISAQDLAQGDSTAAFLAAWQDFAGPAPLLVAWSATPVRQLERLLGAAAEVVLLKAVLCNQRRAPVGAMEAVLDELGLTPALPEVPGRAGRRLGGAVALVHHLRSVAAQMPS